MIDIFETTEEAYAKNKHGECPDEEDYSDLNLYQQDLEGWHFVMVESKEDYKAGRTDFKNRLLMHLNSHELNLADEDVEGHLRVAWAEKFIKELY